MKATRSWRRRRALISLIDARRRGLPYQHVAFGTDMNGLDRHATVTSYVDVRRIVEHWQRESVPEGRIRRIAGENYARVLKQAMKARTA